MLAAMVVGMLVTGAIFLLTLAAIGPWGRVDRVISTAPAACQCAIGEHHESEASLNLQLAHPDPAYGKVSLIEPAPLGYLHIGAEVRPLGQAGTGCSFTGEIATGRWAEGSRTAGRTGPQCTEGHRVRGHRVRSPE